jgi:hypothetical protein
MKVSNTRLRLRVRPDASGGLDIELAIAPRRPRPPRRTRVPLILFLAADPHAAPRLDIGRECAAIQRELSMTLARDRLRFEARWATTVDDFQRHLTELDPTVLHFSGHGCGSRGLILQDEHGRPQPVSTRALATVICTAASSVRLIVLNACYSIAQAAELCGGIDCVVGMNGAIGDEAARVFATRLYGAIGSRRSVGNAVEQAIAALAALDLPEAAMPHCLTRDGVDAHDIVLAR